jgi:hypothetical protein
LSDAEAIFPQIAAKQIADTLIVVDNEDVRRIVGQSIRPIWFRR